MERVPLIEGRRPSREVSAIEVDGRRDAGKIENNAERKTRA